MGPWITVPCRTTKDSREVARERANGASRNARSVAIRECDSARRGSGRRNRRARRGVGRGPGAADVSDALRMRPLLVRAGAQAVRPVPGMSQARSGVGGSVRNRGCGIQGTRIATDLSADFARGTSAASRPKADRRVGSCLPVDTLSTPSPGCAFLQVQPTSASPTCVTYVSRLRE